MFVLLLSCHDLSPFVALPSHSSQESHVFQFIVTLCSFSPYSPVFTCQTYQIHPCGKFHFNSLLLILEKELGVRGYSIHTSILLLLALSISHSCFWSQSGLSSPEIGQLLRVENANCFAHIVSTLCYEKVPCVSKLFYP